MVEIETKNDRIVVHRELEANILEKVELSLPAVLTIQTGINTPRYVSILGIRKVRNIEIKETDADDLSLSAHQIGSSGSSIAETRFSLPPAGEGAEILTGSLDEICEKTVKIIRDKGGIV